MKTLVSLIGEQPIPNLLPILYLKPEKNIILYSSTTEKAARKIEKLISNVEKIEIEPYDYQKITNDVERKLNFQERQVMFNLTGGTKIMSLALFKVALERKIDFFYFQSEGNKSLLYHYKFQNDEIFHEKIELPELITIDYYLKAHLFDYVIDNNITSGSYFEKQIFKVLEDNSFEILSNIRPKGEGNQLEIDLVIKLKGTNNVAIAEIKVGDEREEGPKKGIDQLALACQREYLGTYTKRFLITSRELSKQIKELAKAHGINIIDGLEVDKNGNKLLEQSKHKLIDRLREKLL